MCMLAITELLLSLKVTTNLGSTTNKFHHLPRGSALKLDSIRWRYIMNTRWKINFQFTILPDSQSQKVAQAPVEVARFECFLSAQWRAHRISVQWQHHQYDQFLERSTRSELCMAGGRRNGRKEDQFEFEKLAVSHRIIGNWFEEQPPTHIRCLWSIDWGNKFCLGDAAVSVRHFNVSFR